MAINLFDDKSWFSLRPLTFTRPTADLRVGILTIAEKWAKHLGVAYGFQTQEYLSEKYSPVQAALCINGSVCPDLRLLAAIDHLAEGEVLLQGEIVIAYRSALQLNFSAVSKLLKPVPYADHFVYIQYPENIFGNNEVELKKDFDLLTKGRTSAALSTTNTILGDQIFAEEGVTAECSSFNTLAGPIYLGKNAEVWEGCHIRGAFALCHDSQLKMGTKVYSKTTVGPFSRVGGEINNAVIWGYSSKGHEGYLGNSVLGQWCNLGADTNNSNLKNNYNEVGIFDYDNNNLRKTGLQFCGLVMADHAKSAINTMFNTGTVVGVSANVFSSGFPPKFVPDFAWGGDQNFQTYDLSKMLNTANKVFEMKNELLTAKEIKILTHVFEITKPYRKF